MAAAPAPQAPDLHTAASAAVALEVFGRIADAWSLSSQERQQVLGVSSSTYYRWRDARPAAGLDPAVLERISYVLRIYAALEILLPIPERAHGWLREANTAPLFGGASALARMLGGQVGDLMVVADYLDAQRGGDFS